MRLSSHAGRAIMLLAAAAIFVHGAEGSTVGVAYGRDGNNLPSPGEVASLLQANGVDRVRIYDTDAEVLGALQGAGIHAIVGVSNDQLAGLASGATDAGQWVSANVAPYASIISCVCVGNEVLTHDTGNTQYLVAAMQNVLNAISSAGLAVQVSTSHALDVLSVSFPPSSGKFQDSLQSAMASILDLLQSQGGAPFLANVYPFITYIGNPAQIPLNYALFQPGTDNQDSGNGLHYTNLFDAEVDALVAALGNAGHPDIPMTITESGWPTDGDAAATVGNAHTYNSNLVAHVGSGTPKRPNQLLQTYIFALFNENLKGGAAYEQHFGVFNPDQTKVYDLTF